MRKQAKMGQEKSVGKQGEARRLFREQGLSSPTSSTIIGDPNRRRHGKPGNHNGFWAFVPENNEK